MSDVGLEMGHRGKRRTHRSVRAKGCLAVVIALVVVVAAGAFAYVESRDWLEQTFAPADDYEGEGRGSALVEVRAGDTSADIASSLYDAGVIASEEAFTEFARGDERATLIQVGFYDMARRMSAESAFERLLDTDHLVQNTVTVPEGLTVEQIVALLAEDADLPREALRQVAARPAGLGLPGYAGAELEGYLFPATYPFPPELGAQQALRTMVDRFNESARRLDLARRAGRLELSPAQVVTVASIVQSEARAPEDMAKVARVIYNRLDAGMLLQMDSTVHYAVGKSGDVTTSERDRNSNSPYNTYEAKGLPPGPIASPGQQALAAALSPADGDWIYFVTVNQRTGETRFADTDAQHQRNVAEFQRWCSGHPGQC